MFPIQLRLTSTTLWSKQLLSVVQLPIQSNIPYSVQDVISPFADFNKELNPKPSHDNGDEHKATSSLLVSDPSVDVLEHNSFGKSRHTDRKYDERGYHSVYSVANMFYPRKSSKP